MTTLKGGGRNTVPKPGPGGDLPDITDARSLMDLMKFYNILGHGSMYEGQHNVFLVPENTWILFITRASVVADKRKSGILREVLDNFYFYKDDKETPLEWHQRIFTKMQDGSLFKDILFKTNNAKSVEQGFSIYEPGDLVQDLTLQFTNDRWPYMRLGVWECPIPHNVKKQLNTINDTIAIAKYNEALKKILEVEFPAIKTEYPAYSQGIDKIIQYINDYAKITVESAENFQNDVHVKEALKNTKILKLLERSIEELTNDAQYGKGLKYQYEFFDEPNNLVLKAPSAFSQQKNGIPLMLSTLYDLLTENRYASSFNARSKNISRELLLSSPKYRFIVVDACRSIDAIDKPVALYASRQALTRRLSLSARFPICAISLLQMTKQRFRDLILGKGISLSSAIQKLLRGERVTLPEFEESLVGKEGNLTTVLNRPFSSETEIIYLDNPNATVATKGTILDLTLSEAGRLLYTIQDATGKTVRVPAYLVFKNVANFQKRNLEKATILLDKARTKAKEQVALKKLFDDELNKEIAEREQEAKENQWPIQFSDAFKRRFGPLTKTYMKGQTVTSRVNVKNPDGSVKHKKGSKYSIIKTLVRDGQLGYVVDHFGDRAFVKALNINDDDEIKRWNALKNQIKDSEKHFEKGDRVSIVGMEKAKFLKDKNAEILDIVLQKFPGDEKEQPAYRIAVYCSRPTTDNPAPPPALHIITLKPENLEALKGNRSVNIGIPPETLPSKVTDLVLPEDIKAFIRKQAEEKVRAKLGMPKAGGRSTRKRTQHLRKRSQTKRRLSKH